MINNNIMFKCTSLDDTRKAAEYFASIASAGQCFALYGNLGYGKTTFAQYFIRSLNQKTEEVTSPTFSIMQMYDLDEYSDIIHVDCYRMEKQEEFFELGLEELFPHNIVIIEWPEIIENLLPENTIKIEFSIDADGARTLSERLKNR